MIGTQFLTGNRHRIICHMLYINNNYSNAHILISTVRIKTYYCINCSRKIGQNGGKNNKVNITEEENTPLNIPRLA